MCYSKVVLSVRTLADFVIHQKGMETMKKKTKVVLMVALCLCLISGIFASMFMTGFYSVKVQDLKVVVDDGYVLNAQAYIPKKASKDNKLPLIVLSHGSYNNFDHQDQNMIELARRGFVVISSDAYKHGDSSVNVSDEDAYANMKHLIDYACASWTFIDTDKIGVSGHSMGGMITNETVNLYYQEAAQGGTNRIAAALDQGYDPPYADLEFEGIDGTFPLDIDFGVVAAKYDEWFFKDENGNPATYLENPNAISFINQLDEENITAVENHKVYTGTINGKECIRVINQNTEIHPLNHFSKASCRDVVNFFYEAFGVPSGYEKIDATKQIWQWKEIFNLVGLIGIILFLFPFASMMIHDTKFFAELAGAEPVPAPKLITGKQKATYWVTYAINCIIPALLVVPVAYKLVGKSSFVPYTYNTWFGEPNTNELATWTLLVGICLLAVFVASYFLTKEKGQRGIPEYWGVKTNVRILWKSFLLGLLTVFTSYVILFFNDLVFNTDFRIWVIDMRVFTVNKLIFAVAYVPAWIVFYLVNSLLVNGGNRVEGRPEWLTLLLSCVGNIFGIVSLIFIQYHGIISNGTFAFNSMRIVNLFPLVFLIPVGTLVSRRFFKETGNIYAGSFTIAMLYTMMTVSNTMVLASVLS